MASMSKLRKGATGFSYWYWGFRRAGPPIAGIGGSPVQDPGRIRRKFGFIFRCDTHARVILLEEWPSVLSEFF
jgi:hypothetical protein